MTQQAKQIPTPENFGFVSNLEGCEFIFHTLDSRIGNEGELHIRPPEGMKIGLNVGKVLQNAYETKSQRDELLEALKTVANALGQIEQGIETDIAANKALARAAIAKATGAQS